MATRIFLSSILFCCYFFFYFFRGAQQAAGCKNVLSAACSDGCRDAVVCEVVAKGLHAFLVGCGQVDTWYLMESNEIDATFQSLQ